ncbi:MAG: glycosyltransferase, partial [Ignavibacteriae bacterium]|nr:glycosyltransferase [Ignavibacteriota bacterium]
ALYPIIPPFIPMLKNIKVWKKNYLEWRNTFPTNPIIPSGLENVTVHYAKYIRLPRINFFDSEGWFAYFALKKYVKKFSNLKDTIIHGAWIFPAGHAAELLSQKYKLPFIVQLMGSDVNYIKLNTPRYRLAKKILNKANKITSVSQVLIDELVNKKILKNSKNTSLTHTIYNFSKFSITDKQLIKKDLGIEESAKIIFFAAALRKLKNCDVLIRSVVNLLNKKNNVILLIGGAGYEEDNLRQLVENEKINNNVKFLGNLDEDSIVKYYNSADVFCLPSKSEGLPNVIIESLLCGTPVVASSVGEIPHIIEDNINGFLVEPNSVESLTLGLANALNTKWDRNFLRESVSFLSVNNVLQEYDMAYNDVIK